MEATIDVEGVVHDIRGSERSLGSDNIEAFDKIVVIAGDHTIHFEVDTDTDQFIFSVNETNENDRNFGNTIDSLNQFIDCQIGWSWIARNSNGYQDCILLSFSGLSPDICLLSEASSIHLYRLTSTLNPAFHSRRNSLRR